MTEQTTAAGTTPGRPDPLDTILRSVWNAAGPDSEEPCEPATADAATKDTRTGESTLSSSVLDLLAAIRDAVDVPLPGTGDADERAWHRLMYQRLTDLHTSLDVALDAKWADTTDPADEAAHIRRRTAAAPVTYALFESAVDRGEQV